MSQFTSRPVFKPEPIKDIPSGYKDELRMLHQIITVNDGVSDRELRQWAQDHISKILSACMSPPLAVKK